MRVWSSFMPGLQCFVVFLHETIKKCEQVLVLKHLKHDRCQQNHQMRRSLRVLTCDVRTPIKFTEASLRRQVCGSVCKCGWALRVNLLKPRLRVNLLGRSFVRRVLIILLRLAVNIWTYW